MKEREDITISKGRELKFIDEQSKVIDVNDDVIRELIKYDKFASLLTNPRIIDYLEHRFDDSDSIIETIQRIRKRAYIKPKCPVCGLPTTWIGRKRALFTTYCKNPSCYNGSSITKQKKRETLKEHEEERKTRMLENFGVEHNTQRKEHIEHRKTTLMDKYGTTKLYKVPDVSKKIKDTIMSKTGYDSYFKVPEVREKAYEGLLKNSKTGTSSWEERVYGYFLELGYSEDDVIRHHYSNEFPYPCDFYIKSKNMYIEYQGSQFHHCSAFLGTKADNNELNRLFMKNEERCKETGENISQYAVMADVWANKDTKKRQLAVDKDLKYLELYTCPNKESLKFQIDILELAWNIDSYTPCEMTEQMYEECRFFSTPIENIPCEVGNNNLVIKNFQFSKFYKEEMNIYAHNPIIRRKLIQNRMKYLNKKEYELTLTDILGGFKKSGIHYGYSHFNSNWTNWFCTKFNIKRIYDPCGGWGHHILGMQNCETIFYNDINSDILNNVMEMCKHIPSLSNKVYFSNEDAAIHKVEDVDAFFMCPPYYNLEDYGNKPFDTLDDYGVFLNDIFEIWHMNSATIFGLILSDNYIDLITYKPIDKIMVNATPGYLKGKKKHTEYFYIFTK